MNQIREWSYVDRFQPTSWCWPLVHAEIEDLAIEVDDFATTDDSNHQVMKMSTRFGGCQL